MAIVYDKGLDPIITDHAPSGLDYAQFGTIWVDQTAEDIYVACNTDDAGQMIWVGTGGGSSSFSSISVNPGNATIGTGNLILTAGTVKCSSFGAGVIQSNASGNFTTFT